MNWFGNTLTSLFLVAAGAVVLALVQPVLSILSPSEAIHAEIELSKWIEQPEKVGELPKNEVGDAYREVLRSNFADLEEPRFVTMELFNPGPKKAEHVRFRFEGTETPNVLVISNKGDRAEYLGEKSDVSLPDMAPGDKIRVYMWENHHFPRILFPESLRTFSSLGGFKITYKSPEETYFFEDKNAFFEFIDEWITTIFVVIVILFIILMFAGIYSQFKVIKDLLADDSYYQAEKARYESDPEKYTVKEKGKP